MKKLIIPTLVFTVIVTSFVLTEPTFAATCSGVETSLIECEGGGDAGIWHVLLLIVNILSIGVGITALIGILIFGIQYLTSGGDVAKTTKAKRRMFEIVIGLVGWVLIYSICEWLMPGGKFNFTSDITEISLNLGKNSLEVGQSTKTTVDFTPENTQDKTYSIDTENKDIADKRGTTTVKCVGVGTTTVIATSVNGKTATATITCTEPVEPEPKPTNPSGGGSNPNGQYFTPSQIADFNQKWNALGDQDYNELKNLAKSKGITEDNFVAMVAWARIENYEQEDYGPYFAYLCNSTGVNRALGFSNKGQSRGYLDQVISWGHWYSYAEFLGTNDSSNYYPLGNDSYLPGYYPSNLKSIRMALDYTYPNIYGCSGRIEYHGGYDHNSDTPIYDPKGTDGQYGDSLIFDGTAP